MTIKKEGKSEFFLIIPEENCKYFNCQRDLNDDIAISYCNHPENRSEYEGNCTHNLCPLIKEVNDE